jgi:tyrosyl-tRNA synthetase
MHLVPVGAHDLDRLDGDVQVRLSRDGDSFTPINSDAREGVTPGEPVYATGSEIRTRRWVWRQGEAAKVTNDSRSLLFPVDGFRGQTDQEVEIAVEELAELADQFLGPDAKVSTAFVDAESPAVDFSDAGVQVHSHSEGSAEVTPRVGQSETQAGNNASPESPAVRPAEDDALGEWSFDNILARGLLESVIIKEELEKDLSSGKKLTVYQGFDPTSPNLHMGHYLSLRILRWLQLRGHHVIFLIGDFTGRIGDPTDRTGARQPLTHEQVLENARTYREQIAHVLDLEGDNPVQIKMNGDWLDPLDLKQVIGLAANVTVQRLIERDMFQERLNEQKPLHLHEVLYPLLQGYDSVAMGVDAELGGRDQMFNMMMGRDLVRSYLGKTKHVLMTPLIPGLDGRKMSKTYGNTVDLTEDPVQMFFKLTQVSDHLLPLFLNVFTDAPDEEVTVVTKRLETEANLQDVRERFAAEVTHVFHGAAGVERARAEFGRVVTQGELPSEIPTVELDPELFQRDGSVSVLDLVAATGLAGSRGDGRRLVLQGGFELDGQRFDDPGASVPSSLLSGATAKIGKRGFVRVSVPNEQG